MTKKTIKIFAIFIIGKMAIEDRIILKQQKSQKQVDSCVETSDADKTTKA